MPEDKPDILAWIADLFACLEYYDHRVDSITLPLTEAYKIAQAMDEKDAEGNPRVPFTIWGAKIIWGLTDEVTIASDDEDLPGEDQPDPDVKTISVPWLGDLSSHQRPPKIIGSRCLRDGWGLSEELERITTGRCDGSNRGGY